ncbi:hypothetical protein D9611_007929 [Ephemerocybe angulata]|uniref:Secreted protein n=1 Tax=Ephemerocybe angulata TaxID=980116 RepID=A0A8H5FL46_9AGAR|nr:hypothetical protein D9611_007929 [Tulosesus angulatus]
MIIIYLPLALWTVETRSLLRVLLVIGSAQRQRLSTSLRWIPTTRRLTDTLRIATDLCAFRNASLMFPGLARVYSRGHLVIDSSFN